ncbi:MAG: multicopper oxidase domain-containing protein [Acidimicrobiia bacterium]|nr:multicopper oxidase domain-containing protein [Acidimicrobiia bacterium]
MWTYVDAPEPHYVGVIEYGEATFTMNNGETLTTRAYRQEGGAYSIPGPTLHMAPGNKYVVRFRNLLPYEAPSPDENTFKDPNITNLHTHGLHISGEGSGDDVTRMFEGGFGGDYVYDIPSDHMGGTYWYHAHHHGSTYLQVSTGGFGLIVIDDGQDQIPANVAAMEERHLVIGYLDPAAAGTGGDVLVSGTLEPGWTVNGTVDGTLTVPPNTWQHWRVLLADTDARTEDLTVGANCEVELLARDGVWRTTAPKDLAGNTISLTGASRADLAVRCSGSATIAVGNTTVADVLVAGASDPAPHPYATDGVSTWSALRPGYLRDLSAATNVNTESVSIGARTVNNEKFDVHQPTFTLTADAVQEWALSGATNHPFHLHVYHMQTFGCGGDFEDGEYYDTVAGDCTVRFDLDATTGSSYAGRTIMHCHILGHEDRGAMGWVDVVGGAPPPVFPAGHGYHDYYALPTGPPAAPSGLVAMDASATAVDLSWSDNAGHETIFTIERSPDGSSFAWLAAVEADTTSYTDASADPGATYWYRVRAENPAGASAWTGTASATTPLPVLLPTGFGAAEGNSGETVFEIPITLSEPSTQTVTVDYLSWPCTVFGGCGDGLATEGVDYESPDPGTLTFLPGETIRTVPVTVYGDLDVEPAYLWGEWFLIRFLNPSNAVLDTSFFGLGAGVIGNDD